MVRLASLAITAKLRENMVDFTSVTSELFCEISILHQVIITLILKLKSNETYFKKR